MTTDQIRAIEMGTETHRLIFGAPGSGKTQVLLHRARHLSDQYGTGAENFRVFVYTKALKDYIRSAMDTLDLPEKCVLTLDRWCQEFHRRYIAPTVPWDDGDRQPDFDAVRKNVLGHLQRAPNPAMPMYEFVLVDEGQDLDLTAFAILRVIAQHITVCMDHKQQIYDHGTQETRILESLGLKRRNISLLGAFRCCPHIVKLSATLLKDQTERQAYLEQGRLPQTERMTPLLYYAESLEEEFARLVEVLQARIVNGDRIAILFAQNRPLYACANALKAVGIEVQTQREADFGSDVPKLMTFHSAKGLTFDTVLMPNLWKTWFSRLSTERMERLLFVGITRATRWVYMSAVKGKEICALNDLQKNAPEGCLTVQSAADQPPQTFEEEEDDNLLRDPFEEDEEDDLFDIL